MNDDYYECLTPETTIAILEVSTLSPLTFRSSCLIFVLRSDLKMFHHFCCTSCSFYYVYLIVRQLHFLLHSTFHHNTIQQCTVLHCTVLHCTVPYCIVLYCTVLYCTVLYCTVLYCTVLHCIITIISITVISSYNDFLQCVLYIRYIVIYHTHCLIYKHTNIISW